MKQLFATILLCCTAWASSAVGAEAQRLGFQLVAHTTDVHAVTVPGQDGHRIGVAAFRGLAILADGAVAGHWYSGSFDFIEGAGNFRGYARWVFDDGAELRASYAGIATAAENGGITFTGNYSDVTGTGRFAGLTGDGSFSGRRVDLLDEGGDTYIKGSLTLAPAK